MFLDNLAPHQASNQRGQPKPIRNEYSAGFKQSSPPQSRVSNKSSTKADQDDLFDQLRIGNLRQFYIQSLPPPADNRKQLAQQQRQYVEKLTTLVKKEIPVQVDEQAEKVRKAEEEQRFMQTYHQVENYKEKANKVLFEREFSKVKEKLNEAMKQSPLNLTFDDIFCAFILEKVHYYSQKELIGHEQLLLDFSNFVNHLRIATEGFKSQKIVKRKLLEEVMQKNIFLLGYFDMKSSQFYQLDSENICHHIRKETSSSSDLDWETIFQLLNKKITVPYECALYQPHQRRQVNPQKQNIQDQAQMMVKFAATPIPKSTYHKPKERPKSQMAKTRTQPFNLTVTNTVIPTVEEVYKWNRTFQANQVPKTTYKPELFKGNDQDQKRKRALQLLHSSNYPTSMQYLNNIREVQQQKRHQLQIKYTKTVNVEQRKQVPNFQLIHKQQVQNFEETKVAKRNTTMPQPFNLSHNRPIRESPAMQVEEPVIAKRVKPSHSQPAYQPQTTLKFDAYVNQRKKEKEEKLENQQKKKRDQVKKIQKERVYKQMLKERVDCELGKTPKAPFYSTPISSNMVKVNLDKIYGEQPLLMERQAAKSKKAREPVKKSWEPII